MLFKTLKYIAIISLFLFAMGFFDIPCINASDNFKDCLIQTRPCSPKEILDIIYFIGEQGGQVYHVFPPNIIQAGINEKIERTLKSKGIAGTITGGDFQNVYNIDNNTTQYMGGVSWNNQFKPRTRSFFQQTGTIYNDVFFPPVDIDEIRTRGMDLRKRSSAYMAGTCAVSIVFVECDGTKESSSGNWTNPKKELVVSQIRDGLNWWAKEGKQKAHLTWVYEVNEVTIGHEPGNYAMREDSIWIKDAMRTIYKKYPHYTNYFQCLLYVGEVRERLKTDWGFMIFVCENSNDTDGEFKDGGFAYAYCGGPYMVLTYKNDGWGTDQLSRTTAHEAGHIFGALDEYAGALQGPRRAGVLNVENGNHELYGKIAEECIMKHNSYCLCNYTLGQIGWWDENNDGRFDPDDTWKHPPSKIKPEGDSVPEPQPPPPTQPIVVGVISVKTNPANAEVYVDDILKGESPLTVSNLPIKELSLKVMKSGYADYAEKLRLTSSVPQVQKNITLQIIDPIEAVAENLFNDNPDFEINVKIEKPSYIIGEALNIEFNTSRDCYFYLIDIATDKTIKFLFPNEFASDNFIKANIDYSVPDKHADFDFVVTGPQGKDRMIFIASRNRIESIQNISTENGEDFIRKLSGALQSLPESSWSSKLCYFTID